MSLVKRLDPREGVADFWNEFRRPNPYRWPILGASALMTGSLLFFIVTDRTYIPPERPEVDYITTFQDGRTDAQILADNMRNQEFQDEVSRQIEEREETKRDLFRTLGEMSGMDVERIEREAAEERAREDAAARAQRDALIDGGAGAADATDQPPAGQAGNR